MPLEVFESLKHIHNDQDQSFNKKTSREQLKFDKKSPHLEALCPPLWSAFRDSFWCVQKQVFFIQEYLRSGPRGLTPTPLPLSVSLNIKYLGFLTTSLR